MVDITWAFPTPTNVTGPGNYLDALFLMDVIDSYRENRSQQPVS